MSLFLRSFAEKKEISQRDKIAISLLILLPWNSLLSIIGSVGAFDIVVIFFGLLRLDRLIKAFSWWISAQPITMPFLFFGIVLAWLMIPFQSPELGALLQGLLPLAYAYLYAPLFVKAFYSDSLFQCFNRINCLYILLIAFSFVLYFKGVVFFTDIGGLNRLGTLLSGMTMIVVISFAWINYQLTKKNIGLLIYLFFSLAVFFVVLCNGQRSLFLGVFSMAFVTFIRMHFVRTIVVLCAIFLAVFLYLKFFVHGAVHSRLLNIELLFSDHGRVSILENYFSALSCDPFKAITGWGKTGWGSGTAYQPPHMFFLDLMATFGVCTACSVTIFISQPLRLVFSRAEHAWYYLLVILGLLPYLLTQTYPAERGFTFPIVLLVYFSVLDWLKYRRSSRINSQRLGV